MDLDLTKPTDAFDQTSKDKSISLALGGLIIKYASNHCENNDAEFEQEIFRMGLQLKSEELKRNVLKERQIQIKEEESVDF